MNTDVPPRALQRSDAQRNRARIMAAARQMFTEPPVEPSTAGAPSRDLSMAEVARRAGVGRATLYRNFPDRRDLLEALFADEVEDLIAAAAPTEDPGKALVDWLRRFAAFEDSKRVIAKELLEYTSPTDPIFGGSRQRVIAAGEPLMTAAQAAGHIRADVTLVQALDLVLAVARLDRPPDQIRTILQVALDGLRPSHNR